MRGKVTLMLTLAVLLMASAAFAQPGGTGSDWQFFNAFNLVPDCEATTNTLIPSHYTTDFSVVESYTPVRRDIAMVPDKDWATYDRGDLVWDTGVYGLDGVDEVNRRDEVLIGPRTDRAVLRLDMLAASHTIYIDAIKLTIWGNDDFDPNFDLAPLHPDSARELFGVTSIEEDYYTGVQFYVERDDGDPAREAFNDIFENTDIMALPEKLEEGNQVVYRDFAVPYDASSAAEVITYMPYENYDEYSNLNGSGGGPSDGSLDTMSLYWAPVEHAVSVPVQTGCGTTVQYRTFTKWQAIFPFDNPIAIPPQASWSGRNLPFKRIWVVLRSNGCHHCNREIGEFGITTGIEGISVLDTFFVGFESIADFTCHLNTSEHDASWPPEGRLEVIPDTTAPENPMYERWYKSEWIAGCDTIKPYIYSLYPRNVVGSNGPHSDCIHVDGIDAVYGSILTEHEWLSDASMPDDYNPAGEPEYIYTADSTQLISFIGQDRQTCLDSGFVEIRYLNGSPFPCRIDTIFFRNPPEYDYDTLNGGHGLGWEWNIKADNNDQTCITYDVSGWSDTWSEAGVEHDINGCGTDSFWIAVGCDGPSVDDDYLDPFLDGALVQVKVMLFNRNDHYWPFANATYAETSWVFVVDLSGPTATLVCPTEEGHDNETREFRNYAPTESNFNRTETVERANVPFVWMADSLPMLHIYVEDDYHAIHDTENHAGPPPGDPWSTGVGGSGFNQRDFEIMLIVERAGVAQEAGCEPTLVETLYVTEEDLEPFLYCGEYVQGIYVDEEDDGYASHLYVSMEHLYHDHDRADWDRFMLESGDKMYVIFSMFFDDPDYGQGSQEMEWCGEPGHIDLYPSDSWCSDEGADPNYGTDSDAMNHECVMAGPVDAGCPGYITNDSDTLGIIRIDLEGPIAPDTLYYPPHNWVTSDTFQVITVDLFDQVGVPCVDDTMNFNETAGTWNALYYGVSGVHVDSIIMNIKVRGCDGSWHPYYDGHEGRDFMIRVGGTGSPHPASLPNLVCEKIRMHNATDEWWGTRVVFDPWADDPVPATADLREYRFRPGDEVCVTVYACDNAYLDCGADCAGFGPCPIDYGGCDVEGQYYDGVQKFEFTHYWPGMNWAEDQIDPDGLTLDHREVGRFTFYVDHNGPEYVATDWTQCPFGWDITVEDVAYHVGPDYCDAHVADVAALDIHLITMDDEDCDMLDGFDNDIDTIFINNLGVGDSVVIYHDEDHIMPPNVWNYAHPNPDIDLQGGFTAYYGHGMDYCAAAPCCTTSHRWGRKLHVWLEDNPENPERQAILHLYWGDSTTENCHFFEPGDNITIEINGADAVNVPWFPASERQANWRGPYHPMGSGTGPNDYYVWHHEDDCYTYPAIFDPFYSSYTLERCNPNNIYTTEETDFDSSGITFEIPDYCDYENPNWTQILVETHEYQRDLEVPMVNWFNDPAYDAWKYSTPFNYPPDLRGVYTDMEPVAEYMDINVETMLFDGLTPGEDSVHVATRFSDHDTVMALLDAGMMSMYETDYYLDDYAKDLNWISFEIQTCTDSLVYECRLDDELMNWAPYVYLVLEDAEGTEVWSYEDWYDCDCIHCWLHYTPLRDGVPGDWGLGGCVDGGLMEIGPLDYLVDSIDYEIVDSVFVLDTMTGEFVFDYEVTREVWGWPMLRDVEYTTEWDGDDMYTLVANPVFGYLHGDKLTVVTRFATRNANQFGIDTLADLHYYAWAYNIDMMPPTAHFTTMLSTTGYEEVNCVERHATNHTIRARLESISDSDVDCSSGGMDIDWSGTWPLPAVVYGTDYVRYLHHSDLDEDLELVYNTGTHWLYTNEAKVIHNCADEDQVASTMMFAEPVTFYHGIEGAGETATVIETTVDYDTMWIADSLWAEVEIQDRLGNTAQVTARPMGLDNGLPAVKGICFATPEREVTEWDYEFDTLGVVIDSTPVAWGEIIGFNDWDSSLYRLPWNIPDQDSLIGVFNFSPLDEPGTVCTVFVRILFNDHMDMRDIDPLYGHVVRFQPQGWTHWFPVMPIDAHAGFFPLSNRYADYKDVDHGPIWYRSVDPGDEVSEWTADISDIEPGWNSDREWIGFMVISGEELMDGVAKLRIQGFDDNAGNMMLDHEYAFRIETRYHPPIIGWPSPELGDSMYEYDEWEEPYMGGIQTLTGYANGDEFGACYMPFEDHGICNEINGYGFDRTITDSVVFMVWYHDDMWLPSSITGAPAYQYTIDDMAFSPDVWDYPTADNAFARVPCDMFDLTDLPSAEDAQYATIEMRAYSRFYPSEYLSDTLMNTWINNTTLHCHTTTLTEDLGGEFDSGTDEVVIQPTRTEIRFVLEGDDAQLVDWIRFRLLNQVTGEYQEITDWVRIDTDPDTMYGELYYDAVEEVIIFDWDCAGLLVPGLWSLDFQMVDEITLATGIDTYAGSETVYHQVCCRRNNILIPRRAMLVRGDNMTDAFSKTNCVYPGMPWSDDIYPWTDETFYPDYPSMVYFHSGDPIVEGSEHLDRFQITTYNNPDWTSGDTDPLRRPFVEQGGYPGDSLYVFFEVWPIDSTVDSVFMVIQDEYGGDISGSNFMVELWMHPEDVVCMTDCYTEMERCFYVYPWIVDDQDNRYDGPVEVTFTTYEHAVGTPGVALPTDHPSYFLLDTSDPTFRVELLRTSTGAPMRTCLSVDMPAETIWVTNADTVDLNVDWYQTVYDQEPGDEDYTSYDMNVDGRIWDYLRLSIDGMPHHGYDTDDPNDVLEARFWHLNLAPDDATTPGGFWHQPEGGYDVVAAPYDYFAQNRMKYRWTISNNPAGNGLALIMVKGRDAAGNILDYEEVEDSDAFGKWVLIDSEAPTIEIADVHVTTSTFEVDVDGIDDNHLGDGFYDPITGAYVEVTLHEVEGGPVIAGPFPVNDDGSVDNNTVDILPGTDIWICATDLAGNTYCVEDSLEPEVFTCEWDLCPGWNLVSLSVIPTVLSPTSVFAGLPAYINEGGTFVPAPNPVDPNYGYLVLAPSAMTITVTGTPNTSVAITSLDPGWNTIAVPWGGAPLSWFHSVPASAWDPSQIYDYDCATAEYVPVVDDLEQCKGYMVWFNVATDSFWLAPSKVVTSARKRTATPLWAAHMDIVSNDVVRTLEAGAGENATVAYDEGTDVPALPVMPEQGNVYLGDYLASDYRGESDEISWTLTATTDFVLTVDASDVPEDYNFVLTTEDGTVFDLRNVENTAIKAGTHTMTATRSVVPTEYALMQNVPNPFNAATKIAYDLPEKAAVSVEVFDVSGHKVRTLVSEEQNAGSRTVIWDGKDDNGANATSGVYFYRINAGSFSETKRMILSK